MGRASDDALADLDDAADEVEDDEAIEAPPSPPKSKAKPKPPPKSIKDLKAALDYAKPRPKLTHSRGKGPCGARLSRALAQMVADGLGKDFPGILPSKAGTGHESRARTAKDFKQLDVNNSTVELGLGVGVSIKTINYHVTEDDDVAPGMAAFKAEFTEIKEDDEDDAR